MSIRIGADSTCDLTPELLRQYDISVCHLGVVMDGKPYRDGLDITPQDMFDFFARTGAVCQTTAGNIQEYTDYFHRALEGHDALIHFILSGDMSSSYRNACLAAESFDNVYVVDSRSLSSGIGQLAMDAAIWARQGCTVEEILARVNEEKQRLEVGFMVKDLKYLHKGGRCSGLAAMGGNLLQLKPCIEVRDGKMEVGKKYRGTFEKSILRFVEERLQGRTDIDLRRLTITGTALEPQLVETVLVKVRQLADFREILVTEAGCSVSCHCGPGCLGLLFFRNV